MSKPNKGGVLKMGGEMMGFRRECCRITVDLGRLRLRMRRRRFVMEMKNTPFFRRNLTVSTVTIRDLSEIYFVKTIARNGAPN